MTEAIVAGISGLVTVVLAVIGAWVALAKAARRSEAREEAREERRRESSEARERALVEAVTRSAEAQAQTAVILEAVRANLAAMTGHLRALRNGAEGPDSDSEPPPIPHGRTIHRSRSDEEIR